MYAFCACLHIVVSNTYYVVFLLDFSSSYLPDATLLIAPSVNCLFNNITHYKIYVTLRGVSE